MSEQTENPSEAGYWEISARPLTALLFVAPLLVIYEAGLFLADGGTRNAADIWLRRVLEPLGFGQVLVLPIATVVLLLAWHHLARHPWQFGWLYLPLMAIEAAVWAVALVGVAQLLALALPGRAIPAETIAPWAEAMAKQLSTPIAFIGAGLYEELLFRVLLLPAVAGLLHLAGLPRGASWGVAAAITAIVFALAHYLPGGETFVFADAASWHRLLFRAAAGGVFGAVFLYRGFGIAAGGHVAYDLLTLWL